MAKAKSQKKKDPNAPKKPKTAYFLYSDEHREAAKQKVAGNKSASEVSKILGAEWNSLSEDQKKPYNERYKAAMEIYKKELEEYKKNKPESESESEESDEGNKKKRKKKGAKKTKDENAPKRPLTSYMLFSQSKRKEILEANPTMKVTEVAKEIGALWKNISAEEKQPFIEQAEKLKKAYQIEKSKYDATQEPATKKKKKAESEDESDESEGSEDDSE